MKEITRMKLSDLYFKRLDATLEEIEEERVRRVGEFINKHK
jgi:hypothetical protein